MHCYRRLTFLGLLLATASATPTKVSKGTKQCVQLEVPVHVSATNSRYDIPQVNSTIDSVDYIWNTSTWSSPSTAERITGPIPVDDTFAVSAQLCIPTRGDKSDILQIATHGVGFDKRYWDVEIKSDEYSYVDAAIRQGYSILTYDRLGTGLSEKVDAYETLQAPVQIEILKGLTILASSGKLVESSKIKGGCSPALRDYRPDHVVHVGHSFGTFLTLGLLGSYGHLSDGAILTGVVPNNQMGKIGPNTFGLEFAAENDPHRFGDRPSGYLVQGYEGNVQQIFLKKGSFEPELLRYAEQVKQTTGVTELLSGEGLVSKPAADFKGPVEFFIGEFDYPLCDGDCKNTYDIDQIKKIFPGASDVSVYLQPRTGHGLTLSTNATAGYQAIFSYLDSFGL